MGRFEQKPTPYYHMAVVEHVRKGWKVVRHSTYHNEKGTILSRERQLLFVGWSGRVVMVLHADD